MTTPMTKTVSLLLSRATDYEQKALALRVAAAELNGHQTQIKQTKVKDVLAQAIALRDEQRPALAEGKPPRKGKTPGKAAGYKWPTEKDQERRRELIRMSLAGGEPKATSAVLAYLGEHGVTISPTTLRTIMRTELPEVLKQGKSDSTSRWFLPVRRAAGKGTPQKQKRQAAGKAKAAKAKVRTQATTRGGRRGDGTFPSLDRARTVATILQDAGKPLTLPELKEETQKAGVRQLVGIHNYVRQGFIKRHVNGDKKKATYSFVAMPPAPAKPQPAA